MRFSSILALTLALHVVAQSPDDPEQTNLDPEPEPTQSDPPETIVPEPTITEPATTETETATTEPTITPTSTAAPPSGGGATCVQTCLTRAASQAGCKSGADSACVCKRCVFLFFLGG